MDNQALRERIWDDLESSGEARFPFPPHGRIPNFAGADEAAERLAGTDAWTDAAVLKANPDAPQLPVRRRALRAGKTVFMAVPRLRDEQCFMVLDPARIDDVEAAATVSSAAEFATRAGPEALPPIDLVVCGSVAVAADGARVGKGEGYSDLEYAILRDVDRIDGDTPVVTTVHERQVVERAIDIDAHDVSLDVIVTPERTIRTDTRYEKPTGVDRSLLDEERITEMPVLSRYRQ